MKLRDYIHETIETLDERSLTVLCEQLRLLEERQTITYPDTTIPTLEEVLSATASVPGSWSDDIVAEREERL